MLAWARKFRLGVFALAAALVMLKLGDWLFFIHFRFLFHRLQINYEGATMEFQAVVLFPAAVWLTRPSPLGRGDPARRRRVMLVSLVALFVLGVSNLLSYRSLSYVDGVLLMSGYALGPIVFAICIFLVLGPIVDVTGAIPNSLPRLVVQAVRWLLGYALLGPALANAVINFARIRYIRGPTPTDGFGINPTLQHWMEVWLWLPGNRLAGPLWLATLLILTHTFYRLHGPSIVLAVKDP